MKQIINGKIYNTETAECIGGFANGCTSRDFNFLSEWLFKTKKGQYFIRYSGGPNTEYAERHGSTTSGSRGIKLITREEILYWLEKNSYLFDQEDEDSILAELGEIEEG